MTPPTKLRRDIEPAWVAEYVATFYPKAVVKLRCPLGRAPAALVEAIGEQRALNLYRPSRPEVDACVLWGKKIILIEAKIFKFMDGLAKLPVYAAVAPDTPELKDFKTWEIVMELLVTKKLAWVEDAAIKQNIKLVEWSPKWVKEIWDQRNEYWTAEAQEKRDQRKKVLKRLGYE